MYFRSANPIDDWGSDFRRNDRKNRLRLRLRLRRTHRMRANIRSTDNGMQK